MARSKLLGLLLFAFSLSAYGEEVLHARTTIENGTSEVVSRAVGQDGDIFMRTRYQECYMGCGYIVGELLALEWMCPGLAGKFMTLDLRQGPELYLETTFVALDGKQLTFSCDVQDLP